MHRQGKKKEGEREHGTTDGGLEVWKSMKSNTEKGEDKTEWWMDSKSGRIDEDEAGKRGGERI